MRPLAIQDAAWLAIERPQRPMHVGGLMLFEPPPDASPTWLQEAVTRALDFPDVRPPMNRTLRHPYGRLGTFAWVDTDIDLTYHIRHLALPQPGRIRELLSLVSRLHANLLDRHRPLWEMYLIEGLDDGRIALYGKFHHSLLDGVAATRQILASFSTDKDERDLPPPWASRADVTSSSKRVTGQLPGLLRTVGTGVTATMSTVGAMRAMAGQLVAAIGDEAEVAPFQAPPSMLNVPLTASRRFVAQSYPLDRIRRVAKTAGVTLNDAVLAMCGGALRAYLASHDALPSAPLIALVPVNIRTDESDEGNAITFLLANLGTHLADPIERLQLIHDSMDAGKRRLRGMTQAERLQYGIALASPLIVGQLTGMSTRVRPLYNVVISNVPGPPKPLYWNGARLDGIYPLSLIADGFALNITQTSYAGSMEFGLTADRQRLPSVQRLIDHLEDALADMERELSIG
jgi:diacylglycerol O-acyltransferase / wax synthase